PWSLTITSYSPKILFKIIIIYAELRRDDRNTNVVIARNCITHVLVSCCRLPVPNIQSLQSWASSMLSSLSCITIFMLFFHVNFGLPLFFFLL
ncbi:hypothetical protein L9F63_007325, partial [Diploptera punctata]